MTYPVVGDVRSGVVYGESDELTGTFGVPLDTDVKAGVGYGADSTEFTGSFTGGNPSEDDVRFGVTYGPDTNLTGNMTLPADTDVTAGVQYGANGTEITGTLAAPDYPAVGDVRNSVTYANATMTGTLVLPEVGNVIDHTSYGTDGTEFTGTYAEPSEDDVRSGTTYGTSNLATGNMTLPVESQVETGVTYGTNGVQYTGTLEASGSTFVKYVGMGYQVG